MQAQAKFPFHGGTLVIDDRARAAEIVARLIVGQLHYVEGLLQGLAGTPPTPTPGVIARALAQLAQPVDDDGMVWRRDGWVFQYLSWIATVSKDRVVQAPHMQEGEHGLDNLYLEFDPDSKPILTICEDKATDHPRRTVRDEVLPEFKATEQGLRDAKLQSKLTVLLRLSGRSREEIASAIESVQWETTRRYAATVTTAEVEAPRLRSLYKEFDVVVPGDPARRAGNVFHVTQLRPWMRAFCADVATAVTKLSGPASVAKPAT